MKAMFFHGKPKLFAQTKGRAFCLKQAKNYGSTELVVLTVGEKLINLRMLSNRLGSLGVTLEGSFLFSGCGCAP